MISSSVSDLLKAVAEWAAVQPAISGVALVGSHASGKAKEDSDIDLVLICIRPEVFLSEPNWITHFGVVDSWKREEWGRVTSLRVHYSHGIEVEFGLTDQRWATLPLDEGTLRVVSKGMTILWDSDGALKRLEAHIQ